MLWLAEMGTRDGDLSRGLCIVRLYIHIQNEPGMQPSRVEDTTVKSQQKQKRSDIVKHVLIKLDRKLQLLIWKIRICKL